MHHTAGEICNLSGISFLGIARDIFGEWCTFRSSTGRKERNESRASKLSCLLQTQPVILDTLTPIDEDIEEENEEDIPEIVETAPSPLEPPEKEIKQIESVL